MEEARIRDIYDDFLYYFSRFYHFIESRLLRPHEIEPYLRYWIEEIAGDAAPGERAQPGDHKWRCALIGFIWCYRYYGVINLFEKLGHRIDCEGPCWKKIEAELAGDSLLQDLKNVVRDRAYLRLHSRRPSPWNRFQKRRVERERQTR
jgi:hypothetical protein